MFFDDTLNNEIQLLGEFTVFTGIKHEKIIEQAREKFLYSEFLSEYNIESKIENQNKVIFYHDIGQPKNVTVNKQKIDIEGTEYTPPAKFEHPIICYD